MGFIVGGPPQPPMVVPQAMEQLLRRPDALAGAQQAARDDDDKLLAGYVFEAMRFDPLAPCLPRVATRASTHRGRNAARRQRARRRHGIRRVQLGDDGRTAAARSASVQSAAAAARIHPFRLRPSPCFGIHMNKALLPLMLKPLLKRQNLGGRPGLRAVLTKRGAFRRPASRQLRLTGRRIIRPASGPRPDRGLRCRCRRRGPSALSRVPK